MPTFVHGKGSFFSITSSTGGTINLSSGIDDASFPRTVETAEVTTFGDNDKFYIVGLRDATISIAGHFNSSHAKKLEVLAGWSTQPTFVYAPEGTAAGSRKYTGKCILTSFEASGSASDKVSMSVDFQCSGAITSTNY